MSFAFWCRGCTAAIVGSVLLSAVSAQAASPPSVAGDWSATANQSLGTLSLTQGTGSPTAACKPVSGIILGSLVQGSYCPGTGRIVVARLSGGVPFQVYQAWVGTDGVVDRMGGSFLAWNSAGGGPTTDYNFSATK